MIHHPEGGAFAVGHGVHHFASAVDAIAAGVVFRIAGAAGGAIHGERSAIHFQMQRGGEARLAEGGNHHVAGHLVFAAGNGFGDAAAFGIGGAELGAEEFDGGGASIFFDDGDGLRHPMEADAFHLGVIVLELEGGHFGFAAAVDEVDIFRSQAKGGVGGVDGGVAAADDDDGAAGSKVGQGLVAFDEAEGVDDAGEVVAGEAEAFHGAEADADEDEVEFALQLIEGDVGADFGLAELDAHRADHFDFAEAVGGTQFVLGDAVGVESAGQRAIVEDGDAGAVAAQFGGAGERCRSTAHAGDFEVHGGGARGEDDALGVLHGVALQAADFDGLLIVAMHHAGAFAQDVHGTDAGATQAEDVGIENGLRGAAQIAGGDLLDEARHVDVGGAGRGARSIETVEAAVGFHGRGLRIEGGMEVRETFEIARDHLALPTAAAATAVRLLSRSWMKLSTSLRPMFMGGVTRITLP